MHADGWIVWQQKQRLDTESCARRSCFEPRITRTMIQLSTHHCAAVHRCHQKATFVCRTLYVASPKGKLKAKVSILLHPCPLVNIISPGQEVSQDSGKNYTPLIHREMLLEFMSSLCSTHTGVLSMNYRDISEYRISDILECIHSSVHRKLFPPVGTVPRTCFLTL